MTSDLYSSDLPAFLDDLRERMAVNLVSLSEIRDEAQRVVATSSAFGISLATTDIPLHQSICRHVHTMNFPLVVNDTLSHPLLQDVPGIRQSMAGAYLGSPVRDADGRAVAVLAALHDRLHAWRSEEIATMSEAACGIYRYLSG